MLKNILPRATPIVVLALAPFSHAKGQLATTGSLPAKASLQTAVPHRLIMPPSVPAAPPQGISVAMQSAATLAQGVGGAGSAAFSLGMASTFSIQTQAQTGYPNSTPWGTGSVQFVAGNDLPMWMQQCLSLNCSAALTITNASPQGVVVYVMTSASITSTQLGPAIAANFTYRKIAWTYYNASGQVTLSGSADFTPPAS